MRMSSFLMGGIVGAAAVMYFSRNNRPMLFSAFNQAAEKAGRFMNASTSIASTDKNSSKSDESQIKNIVQSDPELKDTVNEILSENHTQTSFQ